MADPQSDSPNTDKSRNSPPAPLEPLKHIQGPVLHVSTTRRKFLIGSVVGAAGYFLTKFLPPLPALPRSWSSSTVSAIDCHSGCNNTWLHNPETTCVNDWCQCSCPTSFQNDCMETFLKYTPNPNPPYECYFIECGELNVCQRCQGCICDCGTRYCDCEY